MVEPTGHRGAWFHMLIHYEFDIDKGAVLDYSWPSGELAPAEEKEIRNLAFPEMASNQVATERQTMTYCFRVRQEHGFSYGYTLYVKTRDAGSKRGWHQQSYVLLSELNLVSFYYKLLETITKSVKIEEAFQSLWR